MPSPTVENYLKAVLQIELREGGEEWVTTGQLADRLNIAPGSATGMMQSLSDAGLMEYRPYGGVRLTVAGRKLAMQMLRRHRLLELFLVETLGLSWDQVHEEAENMEHAVSEFVIDRIDAFLGHPEHDPHGDPIPSPDGQLRGESEMTPLSDCTAGQRIQFARVIRQDPEFLQYLTAAGHEIGATGIVRQNNTVSGIMAVEVDDRELTLSLAAAEAVLVRLMS